MEAKRVWQWVSPGKILMAVFVAIILLSLFFTQVISSQEISQPEFRVLSMKALYPTALVVAKEWRQDAYLNWAILWVSPEQESTDLRAHFGFESKGELIWLGVTLRETSNGIQVETTPGDYLDAVELFGSAPEKYPIHMEDILLDSIEALEFLQRNGGDDFFQIYPNGIISFIQLEVLVSITPTWDVVYSDLSSRSSWHIGMSATTNEMVEAIKYDR